MKINVILRVEETEQDRLSSSNATSVVIEGETVPEQL